MDKGRILQYLRGLGNNLVESPGIGGMAARSAVGGLGGMAIGAGVDALIPGEGNTFQEVGTGLGLGLGNELLQIAAMKMKNRPNPNFQQLELNL